MGDTLESLQRRKASAAELESVVHTMKAMAASNITQYEMAVLALHDYYRTVTMGIYACFAGSGITANSLATANPKQAKNSVAIVFGTDQGLAGSFNESIVEFTINTVKQLKKPTEVWAVGERAYNRFTDSGLTATKLFTVPNAVSAITAIVNDILVKMEDAQKTTDTYYLFHHAPAGFGMYKPVVQQLLPLDDEWIRKEAESKWPTNNLPQVIGGWQRLAPALIREYLFVSLFKACAESLANENSGRLHAMQRAEKNIGEMLDDLNQGYNRLRQSTIDEELFDVIAGFEALKK